MKLVRNLLMSVLLAASFFVLTEGVLRVLDLPDPGIYAGDIRSFWTLRPNLTPRQVPFRERGTTFMVRTNEAGFRGGPPPADALLCLGDSTTFGWGVEEEEAWPAVLGRVLGQPVINGGVPGYSTHQGRMALSAALQLKPKAVLLAYLVRDVELAPVADADRPPPPWDPHVMQLLRSLRPAPGAAGPGAGWVPRVSLPTYLENLRAMIGDIQQSGASVMLLRFPMLGPQGEHAAAVTKLADELALPWFAPTPPPEHFFKEDPIHLTQAGNLHLGEVLAAALSVPEHRPLTAATGASELSP